MSRLPLWARPPGACGRRSRTSPELGRRGIYPPVPTSVGEGLNTSTPHSCSQRKPSGRETEDSDHRCDLPGGHCEYLGLWDCSHPRSVFWSSFFPTLPTLALPQTF